MNDEARVAPIDLAATSESRRPSDHRADSVVLRTYLEPYPAYADHAVLADAGIDAYVVDIMSGAGGMGVAGAASMRVDLLVRREDLDAASRLLDANRRDSVDIDWDAVDVGEPDDAAAADIAGRDPAAAGHRPLPREVKAAIGLFVFAGGAWFFAGIVRMLVEALS